MDQLCTIENNVMKLGRSDRAQKQRLSVGRLSVTSCCFVLLIKYSSTCIYYCFSRYSNSSTAICYCFSRSSHYLLPLSPPLRPTVRPSIYYSHAFCAAITRSEVSIPSSLQFLIAREWRTDGFTICTYAPFLLTESWMNYVNYVSRKI